MTVRKGFERWNLGRPGLVRDAALAFIVRGLGALAAFLMSLSVTRALPVVEAGYFFLGIAVVSLLVPVGLLGTNNASLRFIGASAAEADWGGSRAVARTTWLWAGGILVCGSGLLGLTAPLLAEHVFGKPPFGEVLRGMAPALALVGGGLLLAFQLQAVRRVTQSIVVLSVGVPMGVAVGAWVLPTETATGAAALYIAAAASTLVLGLYWWQRAVPAAPRTRIDQAALWATCRPLWAIATVAAVTTWSSQFVAGIWVSAESVAQLALAQRTANLVSFILVAINLVVAPRFAALYNQGRHVELRRLALRSVRLMALIGIPVVLALCLFPASVMGLFGEEFRAAAPLLVILVLGQFVNVMTGSVGYLLTMSGHERDMRNIVLFSCPFAVTAAVVLTPLYGVTGAAVATALAVAVQNLGAVWWVRKRLGFNTLAIWERVQ